jgi:hypothetical protein
MGSFVEPVIAIGLPSIRTSAPGGSSSTITVPSAVARRYITIPSTASSTSTTAPIPAASRPRCTVASADALRRVGAGSAFFRAAGGTLAGFSAT